MALSAYYNEIDPKAAAWLRELIRCGHIVPGVVDERSILDVLPSDLDGFTQCHFFAGIGVWSHALRRAGWPDDEPVWTGSCPCQPFSAAGKGDGFADERHLWPEFFRLISERRPGVVFGEQVENKDGRAWLDAVQADMESLDYAFGPVALPAAGFGAPHARHRLFFVAESESEQHDRSGGAGRGRRELADGRSLGGVEYAEGQQEGVPRFARESGAARGHWASAHWIPCRGGKWRPIEPGTFPLANGAAARMGRLRGYGNAIVAPVAQEFIEAYQDVRA